MGFFYWPGKEAAMGIIVVSLPCTAYHWGTLVALTRNVMSITFQAAKFISTIRADCQICYKAVMHTELYKRSFSYKFRRDDMIIAIRSRQSKTPKAVTFSCNNNAVAKRKI